MLEIGQVIGGQYKILKEVGHGGMSTVYLAMNEKANRNWAVKVVRKDGAANSDIKRQRLAVERDIMIHLKNKYLPSVADVIDTEDSIIIIMDYIEGNSLDKALRPEGHPDDAPDIPQPQDQVIKWAMQLCEVLHYLHTDPGHPPVIYRDMKPANIMLRPDDTIALIDFGTAREYKGANSKDTIPLGTPGYAAPEQYNDPNRQYQTGVTDARTDIYSLGVTLYHLLTGKDPTRPPYDILPIRQINPNLSPALEEIIIKCTQRDPDKRFQSAAEMLYALEQIPLIDGGVKKRMMIRLGLFVASAVLTVALGATSLVTMSAARNALSADYDHKLQAATTMKDYQDAIRLDPTRVAAYEKLNDFVEADAILTEEEGKELLKLMAGLDGVGASGYNSSVHPLEELLRANPQDYANVCFNYGWSFVSHYVGNDEARYANAAKWFEFVRNEDSENGRTAEMFCSISEITTKIKQLQNSKVTETSRLQSARQELWAQIQNLKNAADQYSEARRLEAWREINNLILKYTADFVEVVDSAELIEMLSQIQSACKPYIGDLNVGTLAQELLDGTAVTIAKLESITG